MVHSRDYCVLIKKNPNLFKDIEYALYTAATFIWFKVLKRKERNENKLKIKDGSVYQKISLNLNEAFLVNAVKRTINDLHIITLRQFPRNGISVFKVAGLFTKHAMDLLPVSTNNPSKCRDWNAHFAIDIAIHLVATDEDIDDIDLNSLVEREKTITQLVYMLNHRSLPGESVEMIYQVLCRANRA